MVDARSYSRNSGDDLVRGDDAHAGHPPPQLVRDRPLVGRIPEREQRADRDRLRVELRKRVQVEWFENALRPDPLPYAKAALEGHERLGMVGAQPVQVCAILPPQMEEMLETGCRHERRPGALSLEQRVRRHRRPVGEALELLRADGASRGDHRLLLSRRGRNLGRPQLSAVQQDGVGKGPADVDAEKGHAKREPTRRAVKMKSRERYLRWLVSVQTRTSAGASVTGKLVPLPLGPEPPLRVQAIELA